MLSDYEKEVLEELEAEFRSDRSPASKSARAAAQQHDRQTRRAELPSFSPRRLALGLLIAFLGMVGLLTAVTLGYSVLSIVLGVFSFSVAVAGIYYALRRPNEALTTSSPEKASFYRRFMERQERRWEERER